MSARTQLATALLTDVGRVRDNNEDAVAEDRELGLLLLADGMGGYNAGEVASGMANSTIIDVLRQTYRPQEHRAPPPPGPHGMETLLLKQAVEAAHQAIYQAAQSQSQCAGMGTTVVAVLLHDDRMSIAHVGDSRLYRLRGGQLEQLTRDHSLQEELIARGHMTREEASRMVRKNIVTRALGVEPAVEVELNESPLAVGDILLLCSDGLSDMVTDEQIRVSLQRFGSDLAAGARHLIDQALDRGGRDNASVVLARVDGSLSRTRPWYRRLLEWF